MQDTSLWKLAAVRGNILVYSDNGTEFINTPSVQKAELLIVKASGTYSYHVVLNYQTSKPELQAVPWLRRLVSGLSPRRLRIMPGSARVGFVVDIVAIGQVFLRGLRLPPVNIIPPLLSVLVCHLKDEGWWLQFSDSLTLSTSATNQPPFQRRIVPTLIQHWWGPCETLCKYLNIWVN
jgi:hypothetical protein